MSISSYLLNNTITTESSRYGGIVIDKENDKYTIYVNSTSTLSPMIYSNILSQTLLQQKQKSKEYTITAIFSRFHIFLIILFNL